MFISDLVGKSSTLQGTAGPYAINKGDLLVQNILGACSPAKTFDYAAVTNAGSTAIAATQYTTFSTNFSLRNQGAVLADGSFVFIDAASTAGGTITLWKYTLTGALVGSVIVDPGLSIGSPNPQLAVLNNGNIVVAWVASGATIKAMVFDQYLNTVAAAVTLGTSGSSPGPFLFLLGLTNGGFAATWTSPGVGVYYAIYTNALAVTKAATLFTGTPAQSSGNDLGAATAMVNLSNGSIGVAIGDSYTKALGYAVLTAAGVATVNYTAIAGASFGQGAGGGGGHSVPEISAVPGFFCVSSGRIGAGSLNNAFVLSNAGVVQGSGFSAAASNGSCVLGNDGTNFWFLMANTNYNGPGPGNQRATGYSTPVLVKIPVTGNNCLATKLGGVDAYSAFNLFYENGFLVVVGSSTAWCFAINASGYANVLPNFTIPLGSATGGNIAIPLGDHCILTEYGGTFQVTKYLSASIIGVSQSTVAAGNAGTAVSIACGTATYTCNAIAGSNGKSFNHESAVISGARGVFYGNSVKFTAGTPNSGTNFIGVVSSGGGGTGTLVYTPTANVVVNICPAYTSGNFSINGMSMLSAAEASVYVGAGQSISIGGNCVVSSLEVHS